MCVMVGRVTFTRPSFPGEEPREAMLAAVGSTDWPAPPAYGHGEQSPPAHAAADRALPRARTAVYEWVSLGVLLGGAALLFLWNLGASGWANAYYSAAALAGSQNWVAMLFGSFDASNAITVDKTPASLWVMSLSARVFGVNAWSILVPQALEGVAAVWLLYLIVRRRVGHAGGLLAGAILALTPVATLMFRFNNPDALLTLLLVAAAYAIVRALDAASTRWLVLAGALIGFAFLAKMLQGFLVIPAFASVYLIAAPTTLWRRIWQVGAAALAVVVAAGWWIALVMLWPADSRPFIGGSQTNNIWDLILGYNGFGRLTGDEVGRVGGGPGPFSAGAGWLRLFQGELGSEVGWLLPAALIAMLVLLWATRRSPRTSQTRAHVLLWGGWLIVTGLVFSLMQGIFHSYYAVALVPPIAALVAMGAAIGWVNRDLPSARLAMSGTVAATAVWSALLLSRSPGWNPWLIPFGLGFGAVASLAVMYLPQLSIDLGPMSRRFLHGLTAGTSVVVLLAVPAVGSIATAADAHTGAIPTSQPVVTDASAQGGQQFAGPGGGLFNGGALPFQGGNGFAAPGFGQNPFGQGPFGRPFGGRNNGGRGGIGGLLDTAQANPELVAALQANASAYRWVAATTGSNNAAGLELSTGQPVMAIGGFNGSDPSPTLAEFQSYVAKGQIHYYVGGADAAGFRGTVGGSNSAAEIYDWVQANFRSSTIGGVTVYDLSAGTGSSTSDT
jgi:4-amino-4-deoxy-L-arabinose transferase-like glycosyltransferase